MDFGSVEKKYQDITEILINRKLTIATMESATSGLVASFITDTPGASAVYKGGYVTYSNEMKISCGVDERVITEYTVYSVETARQMAINAMEKVKTMMAIGITGTMGNIDPYNTKNSIPGRVYFAIAYKDKIIDYTIDIPNMESRFEYKLCVVDKIADALLDILREEI